MGIHSWNHSLVLVSISPRHQLTWISSKTQRWSWILTKYSSKAQGQSLQCHIQLRHHFFFDICFRWSFGQTSIGVYIVWFFGTEKQQFITQDQCAMLDKKLNFKFQPTRRFKREWISNLLSYFVIVQDTVNNQCKLR